MKQLGHKTGVVVCFSRNGWMMNLPSTILIKYWDGSLSVFSSEMHIAAITNVAVRAECDRMRLHMAIVPSGCTKFI